jgi:hypothetical protein
MSNNRALEMFENGQGADCVIEVVPQIDDQEKQVFLWFLLGFCFILICTLLGH